MNIYTVLIIALSGAAVLLNLLPLLLPKGKRALGIANIAVHLAVIVLLVLDKKPLDMLFLVMLTSLCSALVAAQLKARKGEKL